MDEFVNKNYEGARSFADAVLRDANLIYNVFSDIDKIMRLLYGDNYQSRGAEETRQDYYARFQSRFQPLYDSIVNMQSHIYVTTNNYEAADAEAVQQMAE